MKRIDVNVLKTAKKIIKYLNENDKAIFTYTFGNDSHDDSIVLPRNTELFDVDNWCRYLRNLCVPTLYLIHSRSELSDGLRRFAFPISNEYYAISFNKITYSELGDLCYNTTLMALDDNALLDPQQLFYTVYRCYLFDERNKNKAQRRQRANEIRIEEEKKRINDIYNTDYE